MEQERPTPPQRERAEPSAVRRVLGYFASRSFWWTVAGIALTSVLLFALVNVGLGWYTNHGQRLEVGDYEGMSVAGATERIERADFRVALIDSVFLVDQPPGIVLRQDPQPGAFVKENRRIYLTVTKRIPDEVTLPALTGTYDFDRYRRKLVMLDLDGRIVKRTFSSQYQPNTILQVFHDGDVVSEAQLKRGYRVAKGTTLTFEVASRSGGMATVPDLRCLTVDQTRLVLANRRLSLGRVRAEAGVNDPEIAYVYRQDPPSGERIDFDAEVYLYVSAAPPTDCAGQ